MNPFDFFQYPEYFPFFMIWASGYVFIYSLFGRSNEWKNFDSTMKLVSSLVAGFAIEMCLILPIFYLFIDNIGTSILLPAFEKTWMYHWLLTGFVSIIFKKVPNKVGFLKVVHFTFSKILLYFFSIVFFSSWVCFMEFGFFYPTYVTQSTNWLSYLVINYIFSGLAFPFCLMFPNYLEDTINSEWVYKGKGYVEAVRHQYSKSDIQLLMFLRKLKNNIIAFSKSKWQFVLSIIIVAMASVFVPLDANYHLFTPNIETATNIENFDTIYFLSIGSSYTQYDIVPKIEMTFEKITYDHTIIQRGTFDQLNTITLPIPEHAIRNDIVIANYPSISYNPDKLRVIYSEDLENNVTISTISDETHPKNLKIEFNSNLENFNFSLSYLTEIELENVEVYADKIEGEYYNATHDKWIQHYHITNNEDFNIYLQNLENDLLIYETVDKNSTILEINGVEENTHPSGYKFSGLRSLIEKGKTVTITLSFLSTEKFPEPT